MKKLSLILICLSIFYSGEAQLPVFEWAKSFVANNQTNYSVYSNGRSVAVDAMGNVYSAGLFNYTTDFDPGPGVFNLTAANWANAAIYLSKLSPTGDFLWAIQIPTYVEFGNIEIRVDKENNVLIASELRLPTDFDPGTGTYILSPTGGWDAFVAKYSSAGNLIWAKQFGGPGDTVPRSDVLDIDNNNNVIVCGNFNNTVDFDPGPAVYNITSSAHIQAFIVKLTPAGDFIWAKQFGDGPIVYHGSHIADVKCDLQGNIYVTGDFFGNCDFDPGPGTYPLQSKGLRDGYAAKLNPNGNFVWAKTIGNTNGDYYQFSDTRGIDVDANQNVYIAGNFMGTFDFDPGPGTHIVTSNNYDWYALKLNQQGDFVWANIVGSAEGDIGADITVDLSGNVYMIGTAGQNADMDPGPGVFPIVTNNQYGASVLLKVNESGGFIYAVPFDQIGSAYGDCLTRRMVVDNAKSIYITGYLTGTVDFDPSSNIYPLSSGGTESPYVLKLAVCTNVTTSTLNVNECDSFVFNNETFDSTGTYIRIIPNSTGCDSVVTINLSINKKFVTQNITICEGSTFLAGGTNQSSAGIYKDTLRSSLGCDSIVTTNLFVNPKPKPSLGPDRDICTGTQSIVSPGTFNQYVWQDNSTSSTITVNSPGLYWVKVTNQFNCTATDSLVIKSILPNPDNFLKVTDSICDFQNLTVIPTGAFSNYLWSNGTTGKQAVLTKPGVYWLKVTDSKGCTGTDSITLYKKDCLQGVYFPSAFTPNRDGRNDLFKGLVYGKLISYKLQVFDRNGQLIFQATDPLKGWDGSFKGTYFSTATFVWQCSYQLEGRQTEYQKGTVTVVR